MGIKRGLATLATAAGGSTMTAIGGLKLAEYGMNSNSAAAIGAGMLMTCLGPVVSLLQAERIYGYGDVRKGNARIGNPYSVDSRLNSQNWRYFM